MRFVGATPTAASDLMLNTHSGVWTPADSGFITANFDPALLDSVLGTALPTNGVLYLQRVRVDVSTTINNLYCYVVTAGATLTASQNFMALFNDAGTTRLGLTADQSTAWTTAGFKTAALTAGAAVTPGYYKIAFLSNGTTRPAMLRGATIQTAIGATTAARFSTAGTALTAVPTTTGTQTRSDAAAYWVAAS